MDGWVCVTTPISLRMLVLLLLLHNSVLQCTDALVLVGSTKSIGATPLIHNRYPITTDESLAWAIANNVRQGHATTHSLFSEVASYLRSSTDGSGSRASCAPFVIRRGHVDAQQMITFGTDELQAAIEQDFLDAGEGSTNPTKGWRMQPVGGDRRGSRSFQDSRLAFEDVMGAKGTVIFNSAGAYISSTLSASSLAALDGLDGAVSGVCLNMYVTRGDAKVSAPPHTDKQDVIVVQTQGRKHWRVFSPPGNTGGNAAKLVDPFARGKGADDLPLELLESSGSKLLLEVTLNPGDLLFVPARFPHTTDTLSCYSEEPNKVFGTKDWSIHLTMGLDSHVWSMNYLSMRRLGLRRFDMHDALVFGNSGGDDDNVYMGMANSKLNEELREALFSSVDSSMLSMKDNTVLGGEAVEKIAMDLFLLNKQINKELLGGGERGIANEKDVSSSLSLAQCVVVVTQFRDIGQKILNTHRNMYTSAIAEESVRKTEEGGWSAEKHSIMSREQIDRLSIFRVPMFFEELDTIRDELRTWADEFQRDGGGLGAWAASQSILNGDQVEASEADDGVRCSGWSPAKVIDARADGLFDLQQFDGSVKKGVRRQDMKGPHGIGVFI
jgi:hypothetical protein